MARKTTPERKGDLPKADASEKEAPQYARRKFSGLEKLTKEYRAIIQPILGKRGFAGVDIIESWPEIVGEDLALGIRPDKLRFEKGARTNGVLYVKSAGGAFALLCDLHKEMIIARVNTFFGYPAVARLKIVQGNLHFPEVPKKEAPFVLTEEQKRYLEEKTAFIEDEALRKSLYDTGVAFLKSRQKKS